MAPPGGGRNPISNRLLRHFSLLAFVELSWECLDQIFGNIFGTFLKGHFPVEMQIVKMPVVAATIEIYHLIQE
eukprot:5969055-Pyramimonas_sp.AAC.1